MVSLYLIMYMIIDICIDRCCPLPFFHSFLHVPMMHTRAQIDYMKSTMEGQIAKLTQLHWEMFCNALNHDYAKAHQLQKKVRPITDTCDFL